MAYLDYTGLQRYHGKIQAEVSDLNQALNSLTDDIFDTVDEGTLVNNITGATYVNGSSSANPTADSPYIGVNPTQTGYDSYYFIATTQMNLWFGTILSNYVSICHGNNYTGADTTGSGTIRLFCSNPIRYRKSDNNLPTQNSPLSVQPGDVISITVTAGGQDRVYGVPDGFVHVVSSEFAEEVINESGIESLKNLKIVYDDTASSSGPEQYETERLYIYQPTAKGYVRYNFCHNENPSKNSDCWIIHPLYAVSDFLSERYAITVSGEFECALKIDGRTDFMGGSAHGDEDVLNINVFIDGRRYDPDDINTLMDCNEIRIITQSNLYDPDDGTTIAAVHGKEYIWTKDKLTINQSITWNGSYQLERSYLAMLPISKNVIDYISPNDSFESHAFSDGYITERSYISSVDLWSDIVGLLVVFSIPRWDIRGTNLTSVGQFLSTDNNQQPYHKCYYMCLNTGNVVTGDVWQTTTEYQFRLNK